jgi:hypothetical protein
MDDTHVGDPRSSRDRSNRNGADAAFGEKLLGGIEDQRVRFVPTPSGSAARRSAFDRGPGPALVLCDFDAAPGHQLAPFRLQPSHMTLYRPPQGAIARMIRFGST